MTSAERTSGIFAETFESSWNCTSRAGGTAKLLTTQAIPGKTNAETRSFGTTARFSDSKSEENSTVK